MQGLEFEPDGSQGVEDGGGSLTTPGMTRCYAVAFSSMKSSGRVKDLQ